MLRYFQSKKTADKELVLSEEALRGVYSSVSGNSITDMAINMFRHLVAYEAGQSSEDGMSFI
jgi:hypothetical protein